MSQNLKMTCGTRNIFSVHLWALCLAVLLLEPQPSYAAADQSAVVIASIGDVKGLAVGSVVGVGQVVRLAAGQEVTLLRPDGTISKLKGPHSGKLKGTSRSKKGSGALAKISRLILDQGAVSFSPGAVRATAEGKISIVPPDPWFMGVGKSGIHCVPKEHLVIWRPKSDQEFTVLIREAGDRIHKAKWPTGAQSIGLPKHLAAKDTQFSISISESEMTVQTQVIPPELDNRADIIAWMASRGCTEQAMRLLAVLR